MAFCPENIPDEVKNLNQWDCYKLEVVDGEKTKVPYNPSTGSRSKSTDPETWVPFNAAKTAYTDLEHYDGICFFLTPESGLVFIDLDNSITDGKIEPWAMDIVEQFSSYTEISQSGKGLHILIDGTKPGARCRTAAYPHNIEIYDHARQCCLTGDVLDDYSTIEARQDTLDKLYLEMFGEEQPKQATAAAPGKSYLSDDGVIMKARTATNGAEFEALWKGSLLGYTNPKTGKPDKNAADLALMNSFAFYCSGDRSQMERLFSRSQLGQRDKWINRQDYRDRTIDKALAGRTEFYKPKAEEPQGKPEETTISEDELLTRPKAENPILEVRLEPDNVVSLYMAYGKKTCDAYPEYHYTAGLSLLSICSNRNVVLRMAQSNLYPNVWAMNLGKTTVSRKSAAMSKFKRLAEELFPNAALPQSYSPEGLLEELTEKPKGYLMKDEAAAMIEAMEKNYMLEMRDIYCILYDCEGYRRKIRSSQRNKQSEFGAKDPFINILCATTGENFSRFTSLIDLTSGWLLRFIYTFPTYKKPYMHFKPISDEDKNAYAEVLSRLAKIKGLLFDRAEPIEIQLDPEAWAFYQAWQEQRESELVDIGDDIQLAFFGRLSFTALKMAILFTIGRADYNEETTVSLGHIQEACRQTDSYFIPMGRIIADFIAMDEANNTQEKVLATLGRNGGRLKWTALMQKTHIDKDKLEKAVSALVESEEVESVQTSKSSHKPVRWIVLRQLNKIISQSLKPIRYEENKDRKDIKDSKDAKNSKNSLNSLDTPGIPASFAIIAKNASFAKDVKDGVDGDDEPVSPLIGSYLRADDPGLAVKKKVKARIIQRGHEQIGPQQVDSQTKLAEVQAI